MDHSHSFAVMQFCAHSLRGERLNVGLAIISDGKLDVRIPRRLEKLRAISAAVDLEYFRESLESLSLLDSHVAATTKFSPQERLAMLGELGPAAMSDCGHFTAHNKVAYEEAVERLLKTLVDPEPMQATVRKKRTKLSSSLKRIFARERILARVGEGVGTHRIVSNVEIADGLSADFVLKNGSMHVIETVDASAESVTVRKLVADVAVAALVLEQARMSYGEENTKSRLVYDLSATVEKAANSSLLVVENQGADLFNWSSDDDRRRLIESMKIFAVPYLTKRQKSEAIHSSMQSRLKLN